MAKLVTAFVSTVVLIVRLLAVEVGLMLIH
jgi:hypothetical protein